MLIAVALAGVVVGVVVGALLVGYFLRAQLAGRERVTNELRSEWDKLRSANQTLDEEHRNLSNEFARISERLSGQGERYEAQLRELATRWETAAKLLEEAKESLSRLSQEHDREKDTRISIEAQLGQAREQLNDLRANLRIVESQRDEANGKVSHLAARQEQQRIEHDARLSQADKQRESFERQEQRLLEEEAARHRQIEADRDRMWNEHENNVVSRVTELCKLPECQLPVYTNDNLPQDFIEQFGTRFKPDVLIQLENQYVIFDAKYSKAGNLETYISGQVKQFATKANSSQLVYPTVFFVIPTLAVAELRETQFKEKGYRVYIIGLESIPVLLAMFKRLEGYALADKLDPVERENIVNALAQMHQHIRFRNAADCVVIEKGWDTLRLADQLVSAEMQTEISQVLSKLRLPSLPPSELKRLVANVENQRDLMLEMTTPKAMIDSDDIQSAQFVANEESTAEA